MSAAPRTRVTRSSSQNAALAVNGERRGGIAGGRHSGRRRTEGTMDRVIERPVYPADATTAIIALTCML